MIQVSEKYTEMLFDVMKEEPELNWIPNTFELVGLTSDREKKHNDRLTFAECIKVREEYDPFVPYDFLIVVYEPNIVGLSDAQLRILLHHELLHIGLNEKDGTPRIVPHDVEDFWAIIEKHGLNWAEIGE